VAYWPHHFWNVLKLVRICQTHIWYPVSLRWVIVGIMDPHYSFLYNGKKRDLRNLAWRTLLESWYFLTPICKYYVKYYCSTGVPPTCNAKMYFSLCVIHHCSTGSTWEWRYISSIFNSDRNSKWISSFTFQPVYGKELDFCNYWSHIRADAVEKKIRICLCPESNINREVQSQIL